MYCLNFKMVLNAIEGYKKLTLYSLCMITVMMSMTVWFYYVKKVQHDMIVNYDDSTAEFDQYSDDMAYESERNIRNRKFISHTKEAIKKINKDELVHNKNISEKEKIIIVVQVSHETSYLYGLIHSLAHAAGISKTLIIFSHKIFNIDVNEMISKINFVRYVQIYYPFSSQLFPDRFPGDDMQLCTGDFNCLPSVMRSSSSAQKKHFWWWQVTHIFEHMQATRDFNGTVIFLEENQYVLRDFVYILQVMAVMMPNNCMDCEIISLGAHRRNLEDFQIKNTNVTIYSWNSVRSNIAIAFNRSVWNSIKYYRYHFCHYNDYRWDMSLKYLATKRRDLKMFKMFAADAARVVKYKYCNENTYCSKDSDVWEVMEFARNITRDTLPRRFVVKAGDVNPTFNEPSAGYWDDVRDQELCMHFVKGYDLYM